MPPSCFHVASLFLRRRRLTFRLMTERDAALAQIIRRHLDRDAVASKRFDPEFTHLPAHICKDSMLIIQRDAIVPVRQHLGYDAVELQQFLFRHGLVLSAYALANFRSRPLLF